MQTAAFNGFRLVSKGGDIMNRSVSFSLRSGRAQNCRNSLTPSRARRDASAERLDKQWRELCLHATIERDPEKLLRLTAELDKRKRRCQTEALGKHNGN
jgi:hypothetical protein